MYLIMVNIPQHGNTAPQQFGVKVYNEGISAVALLCAAFNHRCKRYGEDEHTPYNLQCGRVTRSLGNAIVYFSNMYNCSISIRPSAPQHQ